MDDKKSTCTHCGQTNKNPILYLTLDILPNGGYKTKDWVIKAFETRFEVLIEYIRREEINMYHRDESTFE